MKFFVLRAALGVLLIFVGGSCAWPQSKAARQRLAVARALAQAPARPQWVGKIILVNDDEHFVLIDAEQWFARSGVKLESLARGTKTGELRTSEVQKRPFVIADIVRGEPARNDEVWEPAPGPPVPAPKSTSAATTAPARVAPPTAPVPPAPWWRRALSGVGWR